MSYSLIYCVTPGVSAVSGGMLHNGHGAAPVVWSAISDKVLGVGRYWGIEGPKTLEKICALFDDASQPMSLRAVLGMTFDHVYIERADFLRAARDINTFLAWAETPKGHANHWPLVAEIMETHADDPAFPALGIMHTSVGDNLWRPRHDEEENEIPIAWDKCWSLYRELERQGAPCT